MAKRSKMGAALAALVVAVAACGGGQTTDPTVTTSGGASATTTGATTGPGDTSTAPSSSGDEGSVTVTIDGTTYELSVSDDVGFPTRCEPDFFGTGQFWVIAVALDEDGARSTDPQVGLSLELFPMDRAADDLGFDLSVRVPGDSSQSLEYLLATDDSVVFQAGEFDGDLGSWTIDGNRIHGEVAVYEYDHIREYSTATFDITCPTD